jgi:DNA processing protein
MHDLQELPRQQWPQLIHEISDPPDQLYLRGTLPSPETTLLAVVGSRKCTSYGASVCTQLIEGLADTNISIVSGLALGIDGLAHQAALKCGLHTIAVPGSGLADDVLYPASHRTLAQRILSAGGALLSEFTPEFRARPESFPQRNRIMAGMSHATLVVEASERSGTLITARLATDYNRDVFAVPGSIFSAQSAGTNRLLAIGAAPITSAADVKVALGLQEITDTQQKQSLSSAEETVLKTLIEPMPRDTLLTQLPYSTSESNILLTGMELKGLIREAGGYVYQTQKQ